MKWDNNSLHHIRKACRYSTPQARESYAALVKHLKDLRLEKDSLHWCYQELKEMEANHLLQKKEKYEKLYRKMRKVYETNNNNSLPA